MCNDQWPVSPERPDQTPLAPTPDRAQFDTAIRRLRAAFEAWNEAKQQQFEQIVTLGWSCSFDNPAAFFRHLDEESERLHAQTRQIEEDIFSTQGADAAAAVDLELEEMRPTWDQLRAEGVPIEKRPLAANLPWSVQFQFQADTDPTGRDLEWWKANEHRFRSLE